MKMSLAWEGYPRCNGMRPVYRKTPRDVDKVDNLALILKYGYDPIHSSCGGTELRIYPSVQ